MLCDRCDMSYYTKFGAQYKEAAECHLRIPALNAMSPSITVAN
jgi:hypothetical protein